MYLEHTYYSDLWVISHILNSNTTDLHMMVVIAI